MGVIPMVVTYPWRAAATAGSSASRKRSGRAIRWSAAKEPTTASAPYLRRTR